MELLTVACVPEQVNIPIKICDEQGIFERHGLGVTVRWVPEGTGKLISLLEEGEVDVAMTVTDALLVGIANNSRHVSLAGTFVESPLVWALAVSPSVTSLHTAEDLLSSSRNVLGRPCKFGVSRQGSGSHTMAHYASSVYGYNSPLPLPSSSFVVANNIDGLVEGVTKGDFDAFLWETFTTKPLFDKQLLKKVTDVSTPWTAFSIACGSGTSAPSESKARAIHSKLFPALAEGCRIFKKNESASSVDRICREFGHSETDASQWLSRCRYSGAADDSDDDNQESAVPAGSETGPGAMAVSVERTKQSLDILKKIGLIPDSVPVESLWESSKQAGIVTLS